MIAAGAAGGALFALIPGLLRAFFSTNEIIVSLMLNYVAALVLDYLIFDSLSYWRDTSTPDARVFPQGKQLPGRGHVARRPPRARSCRSASSSRSRSPRSSTSSTRAPASASRCA